MVEESKTAGPETAAHHHVHPDAEHAPAVEHHEHAAEAHHHAHPGAEHAQAGERHEHAKRHAGGAVLDRSFFKAAAAFVLVACIVFYPIVLNMKSIAPGTGGDTYQNLWDIWWVDYATFSLHTSFYNTNLLFWPLGANLVYQTMPPLFAILSEPLQAISVPFAYNAMFLLGFVLSGLTMFTLADYLVGNKYASFVAGAIFAFSAFHVAQAYGHIEWINIEWIPLVVYYFIRIMRNDGRERNAAMMAVAMVLVFYMGGTEQAIMTSVMLALVALAYAANRRTRGIFMEAGLWKAAGIFAALTMVLGAWGFIPIISTVAQPGGLDNANYLNAPQYNQLWSDDLLSFFLPSYYNGVLNGLARSYFSMLRPDPAERTAYFGYVALALAVFGAYRYYATENGIKLWIALWAVFMLLALGPDISIFGNVTTVPGPYSLYHAIPLVSVVREPGRFDVFVTMAMAVLAAFGLRAVLEARKALDSSTADRRMLTAGISALFLLESAGLPLSAGFISLVTTHISVPPLYSQLGAVRGNYSVLSLPTLPDQASAEPALYIGKSMYYMSKTGKPMIGGYVTRENTSQELSMVNIPLAVEASNLQSYGIASYPTPINQSPTNQTLLALFNYNTAIVIMDKTAYNTSERAGLEGYLDQVFGNPIYQDNTTVAFATTNAINGTLYRSFVSYPIFIDWAGGQAFINGQTVPLWSPINPGIIVVYAPYTNASTYRAGLYGHVPESINAAISFEAMANGGAASLAIAKQVNGSVVTIANISLTRQLEPYSVNVVMVSGPQGNSYLFLPETQVNPFGNQSTVEMNNLRFSRG